MLFFWSRVCVCLVYARFKRMYTFNMLHFHSMALFFLFSFLLLVVNGCFLSHYFATAIHMYVFCVRDRDSDTGSEKWRVRDDDADIVAIMMTIHTHTECTAKAK